VPDQSKPESWIYHSVVVRLPDYDSGKLPYLDIVPGTGLLDSIFQWKRAEVYQKIGTQRLSISRYDGDVKTAWWTMRVRRSVAAPDIPKGWMQDNFNGLHAVGGALALAGREDIISALYDKGLAASVLVHYGDEKLDIYLEK
jgi:hypothetical protein